MITRLKEATDDGLNDLRGQSSVEDVEKMLYDAVDEMKKASSTTDLTLSIYEKCLAIANREVTQKLIKSILILNETKDSPKIVKLLSILTVDFTLKQLNAYCFPNNHVSLTQQILNYLCSQKILKFF